MSMATLQLYKNPFNYPDYGSITAYGNSMTCTPVGTGLKNGRIKVKGTMADFMECNYLSLTRSGKTIYAWIDDVAFHTSSSFEVAYTVDPWRTYRNKIDLGIQYIDRRPEATSQKDPLLGAEQDYPEIRTKVIQKSPNTNSRVFVVQVRPNGGTNSNTPVQPTPYQFWVTSYQANQWMNAQPLIDLMLSLESVAETQNIVTMYSIPYMDISGLPVMEGEYGLPIETPDGIEATIDGFRLLGDHNDVTSILSRTFSITIDEDKEELLRVNHSVQVVIPEAGIINIPDELLMKDDLQVREDVDLFSGASNFMVVSGDTNYYNLSVRGSGVSSIPILSDPMDTYLSQNQNALTTSLIGDMATIAGGVAMMTPLGRAAGTALGVGGGVTAGGGVFAGYSGINNIINRSAAAKDAGSKYSNPPAFLGTALAGSFNNRVWVVVTKDPVDNAGTVHSHFGYQYGKVTEFNLPSDGFIKTEGCNVSSTDGSVPRWAIEEINNLFDNGLRIH